MMNLGQKLHAIRLEKGLTQRELVQRSGIPQPNLSNIEKGQKDFTVSTLFRLCDALDILPAMLFETRQVEDRPKWMSRQRVEKLARAVWGETLRLDENEKTVVQLLQDLIPLSKKRKNQKLIYSAWNQLRQKYSDSEIKILIERVRDEEMRRHAKKFH